MYLRVQDKNESMNLYVTVYIDCIYVQVLYNASYSIIIAKTARTQRVQDNETMKLYAVVSNNNEYKIELKQSNYKIQN